MKANLIRIGNSKGIRIPKPVIEQCHLSDEVELEVSGTDLIIHSLDRPRKGWEEAFRSMASHGDDRLLDPPVSTFWDDSEWEWK